MRFGAQNRRIEINVSTRETLFEMVKKNLRSGTGFALATINLDHLSKLPFDDAFLRAYQKHDLIVADGRPVVWLSQLARKPVELMPGSDLIIPLVRLAAEEGMPIGLLGSNDAALAGAATALKEQAPGLEVVYSHAPAYGFDPEGPAADAALTELAETRAPKMMRALALEWLWRLMQDPKRMIPRYFKCLVVLPDLCRQAWQQRLP